MSGKMRAVGGVVLGSVLLFGAIVPAYADSHSIEDEVRAVAPQFAAGAVQAAAAQESVDVGAIVATLPSGPASDVEISTAVGDFAIGLPLTSSSREAEAHGALVGIDNQNGTHALASVTGDGDVRMGVLISSATAPTEYHYPITAPGGVRLEQVNGWILIRNAEGEFLSYIEPAWAIDANGDPVPTRYELRGDSIVQVVDHQGAAYPVVADPTSSRFFEKVIIDTKADSRGTIVRVYAKGGGPSPTLPSSVIFDDYKTLVSSTYHGQKYRDQLICHVANAMGKKPWNLDSWRPDVGYAATVAAGCNP